MALDPDGKPEIDLTWRVVASDGAILPVESREFLHGNWQGLREYGMVFRIKLPERLPPGHHWLTLTAMDKLSCASSVVVSAFMTDALVNR